MGQQSIQFRPRSSASAAISSSSGTPRSELLVRGMTCSNCARHASEALQSVEGVSLATVDLARGRATVRWKPEATPHTDQLLASLAKAGYPSEIAPTPATPAPSASPTNRSSEPTQHAHDHDHASVPNPWRRSLAIGIPATVLLLAGDWLLGLGMNRTFHWFAFAVALPVQVLAGAGFYRGAWNQLRNRSANMDTLVALGSTAAFGFSVWGLFTRAVPHLFFTEAVTILTLISLGHWLEARMATRAGETLRALLELTPHQARKLTPPATNRSSAFESWTESNVPAGSLVPGDYIALKAGDRVPVDARVVEGQSALDESMLTGESLPVEKAPGSDVLAGTLNTNGRIVARVQATGEGTALAAIVLAVQRAQGSRAAIQRLADQVSSIFVPVVVAIALVAAGAWILAPDSARAVHSWAGSLLWHTHLPESPVATAFYIFCSVLIVACPCAMGIATPVALMAGVNAAARRGILIRDAQALEKSGTVTALVFDKTGTLTEGKPRVVHSGVVSSQTTPDQLAAIAAALARHSQHPLSRAIAPLSSTPVALTGVTEHRGSGLAAQLPSNVPASASSVVRLGSLTWLKDSGVQPAPDTPAMEQAMNEGATVLGLSIDDRLWGWFALRDTLKPQAVQLVQTLRDSGPHYQVHLLSGDHPKAVEAVARELGVDGFKAGVRPETKAEEIRNLQQQGLRVGFVGDGINDAPALAQADLGIAVAKATDAARDAADIVLLRSELDGVREALGLAKATLRTIRQNLFWAFFYNAAAVPLAALGLLSPVICALSMGISDVIVIGNALRLAHKKV